MSLNSLIKIECLLCLQNFCIDSQSTTNKMRLFSIYFCKTLYMFQTFFSVHLKELKTAYTASDICQIITLCAVLSSWWRTEKPSETYRASYRNKLRKVASCWLYSENILAMHGHMNVKFCIKLALIELRCWPWKQIRLSTITSDQLHYDDLALS